MGLLRLGSSKTGRRLVCFKGKGALGKCSWERSGERWAELGFQFCFVKAEVRAEDGMRIQHSFSLPLSFLLLCLFSSSVTVVRGAWQLEVFTSPSPVPFSSFFGVQIQRNWAWEKSEWVCVTQVYDPLISPVLFLSHQRGRWCFGQRWGRETRAWEQGVLVGMSSVLAGSKQGKSLSLQLLKRKSVIHWSGAV